MEKGCGDIVAVVVVFLGIFIGIPVNYYYNQHKAAEIFTDVVGTKTFNTEHLDWYENDYFSYGLEAKRENGTREVRFAYSVIDKALCHSYYIRNILIVLVDADGNEIEGVQLWNGWATQVFSGVPPGNFQLKFGRHMKSGL